MKTRSSVFLKNASCCIIFLALLVQLPARAGPPFRTDDPQPVEHFHWEFYVASAQEYVGRETNATYPHIEINYGAFSNTQIHVVVPLGYVHSNEGTHYGLSDAEAGIKYRVVEETESIPQIGIFPLMEIPTGDVASQLGNGKIQAFLPVWVQKSRGNLTTYGGGGVWYNPGPGRKNWIFAGWELQYDFSAMMTLGSELYYQTADAQNVGSSSGVTVGGYINVSEEHHILFSIGHSLSGETATTGYIGYQYTI